jgi:hypothetical protein
MIYKFFKNIFLFLVLFILLFASSGVSFYRMICSSGIVTHSFVEFENCVELEIEAQTSFSNKCCDFIVDFIKVDYFINVFNFICFLLSITLFTYLVKHVFYSKSSLIFCLKFIWPPPIFHKLSYLKNSSTFLSCFTI